MNSEIIKWLLRSNPWTEYRTRIDLLNQPEEAPEVILARSNMIHDARIMSLINEVSAWPGIVLSSHKSAGQLYHKLSFIADLGLDYNDPGISEIINKVKEYPSDEGIYQLPMNIPVHFGGSGKDQFAWALCDAPILLYSVAKLGLAEDNDLKKAKDQLLNYGRNNGFPCTVSKNLGRFRGPGKKDDPCPYATLIMLKLMNLYEGDRDSDIAGKAIESLLYLWEKSMTSHPYMFYMGNDFRKLKAPLIWYDIIHFADTLSNFSYAINDLRFKGIVNILESKADDNGKFIPESEWKAWKDWDFGQKKEPSPWLTFLVHRIIKKTKAFNY
jgi:hypothetical protein